MPHAHPVVGPQATVRFAPVWADMPIRRRRATRAKPCRAAASAASRSRSPCSWSLASSMAAETAIRPGPAASPDQASRASRWRPSQAGKSPWTVGRAGNTSWWTTPRARDGSASNSARTAAGPVGGVGAHDEPQDRTDVRNDVSPAARSSCGVTAHLSQVARVDTRDARSYPRGDGSPDCLDADR